MSDSESADHFGGSQPDNDDDLFGDGGDDNLSDIGGAEDAGSNHDEDDQDGAQGNEDDDDGERETRTLAVIDVEVERHRAPKPKDGILRSLRVPNFIRPVPKRYIADSFEPDEDDYKESAAGSLTHTIRWRLDPKTGEPQSNAHYCRWSDGSVTLQVGDQVFEVQTKALAPPSDKPYKEAQDAHYYAAAAELHCNQFVVVGHVMEEYTVRPNKSIKNEAIERFRAKMAALEAKERSAADMIIRTTVDPELQKKEAEKAEKERDRDRRKRENAAARMDGLGRSGRSGFGDSDGRRAGVAGRKRGGPGAPKQKRRRPEYDSDDDLPEGGRRQDDYDLGDDFIAPSDEEISEGADEEEEEELDDEDDEEEKPRRKRQKTVEVDDEDAEGEADDAGPSTGGGETRRGRRHIIDDDDDDDDDDE